jgi:hypothetical protein
MGAARSHGVESDVAAHYVGCLEAYILAMKAVDPDMKIIVDPVREQVFVDRALPKIDYLARHYYVPWRIEGVYKNGQPVALESLSAADIWYAWVATPRIDSRGLSVLPGAEFLRRLGAPVAATEWNWNGWWQAAGTPALDSSFAKGVGAAGFVHALMRAGGDVRIGCQSMLVGNSWGIMAIHADRAGSIPAYFTPTGQVTMLYSKYHGKGMLAVEAANVPIHPQPYAMGQIAPARNGVALIDAVATGSDDAVYFHAINRDFERPVVVEIDLSAFRALPGRAVQHLLEGRLNDQPQVGQDRQVGTLADRDIRFRGGVLKLELPRRSVSIVEIPRH